MSSESRQIDRKGLTDEELMELYQSSDYLAFEMLYQRHSGRIYKYLTGKVGSEIGQELFQDTFARIHKSRDKYNTQFPFLPWVFTIVRNLLRDYYKKAETQTVQNSVGLEALSLEASSELASVGSLSQLEVSLESLPDHQRRALRLRYLDDWTFEKIAEEIETSPQNVRQLISRGLKKIRASLNSQDGESHEK